MGLRTPIPTYYCQPPKTELCDSWIPVNLAPGAYATPGDHTWTQGGSSLP